MDKLEFIQCLDSLIVEYINVFGHKNINKKINNFIFIISKTTEKQEFVLI